MRKFRLVSRWKIEMVVEENEFSEDVVGEIGRKGEKSAVVR